MANTTSGSYTFDKTFSIDEVIAEAYERIGLVGTAGHQLLSARRSLNILFQEWGNRGIHFWEVGQTNIDLSEGTTEYIFYRGSGDGTSATTAPSNGIYGIADIMLASYRTNYNTTSQTDLPLTKVDRSTYAAFSNKLTKGTPSQFWVQRLIDKTTLTIYPTADSTAADNYISIYYVARIQDVGSAYTNASDAPYRFVPSMVSGLAFYLSQKYAPQRTQEMKLLYEDELTRALAEDGSAASTYITPKTYYPNI
jgi:hypothetical protein|tara:strand:- start:191 stop:946 length:756 start_codon:yes stop_codon:yes gene_type:complete